jgi:hypothetical protein
VPPDAKALGARVRLGAVDGRRTAARRRSAVPPESRTRRCRWPGGLGRTSRQGAASPAHAAANPDALASPGSAAANPDVPANPDAVANLAEANLAEANLAEANLAVPNPELAADVGRVAMSPGAAGAISAAAAVPLEQAAANPDAVGNLAAVRNLAAVASLVNAVERSRLHRRRGVRVSRGVVRLRRTIAAVRVVRVAPPGLTGHDGCRHVPTTRVTARARRRAHPVAAAAHRRVAGRGTTKPDRYTANQTDARDK